MNIPKQLNCYRFIRVRCPDNTHSGKEAVDGRWQSENNHPFNSQIIHKWVSKGGNYGVLGWGGFGVADIDNLQLAQELGLTEVFGDTFTIKTGRNEPEGRHYYFFCDYGECSKYVLKDPKTGTDLGDIRVSYHRSGKAFTSPYYVVGPGCKHKSGNKYEIINDSDIQNLRKSDLQNLIQHYHITDAKNDLKREISPVRKALKKVKKTRFSGNIGQTLIDDLGLRCDQILQPDKPVIRGNQIVGGHPVHGSESGTNLSINYQDNVWHCFRCGSGGGPLEAYAVSSGVIECSEAQPGCLRGSNWNRLMDALKRDFGPEKITDILYSAKKSEFHNRLDIIRSGRNVRF